MPQTLIMPPISQGNTAVSGGGSRSALNVTAATVIKATPGRLVRINVLGVIGTGGALVINDCTTTGAATAANQIANIPFGSLVVGTSILIDFIGTLGLTVSAVPTGGTPQFAIMFA
jgi:hypothetical protein